MIILIDSLAERYGMLPSQVLNTATTFDMFILDTAVSYRNALIEKEQQQGQPIDPSSYSQEDLLKILAEEQGQQ